jgi:L-alanine-DL-glutamate epimerase-like enolase superfamily enzyme
MKIGAEPEPDLVRIEASRAAIGGAELMIDANGALERKAALDVAERAAGLGVTWFEEPVSSDDLPGLRLLRDRGPGGMEIAAGEYGYDPFYFKRMLDAGAVDVLQADATRCCGYTGFLRAAALADAAPVPVSAHTAPAVHLPVCCAAPRVRNIEWFHDHVRIERMLLEGAPRPSGGALRPDLSAVGHGLVFRWEDAERFSV